MIFERNYIYLGGIYNLKNTTLNNKRWNQLL
jgi:hypothetical protein